MHIADRLGQGDVKKIWLKYIYTKLLKGMSFYEQTYILN